jgi:hypothetical protein
MMTETPNIEAPALDAPRLAAVLQVFARQEARLRQLAQRLRKGENLEPDEVWLLALFVEFHAHYPAATLEAFAGQPIRH